MRCMNTFFVKNDDFLCIFSEHKYDSMKVYDSHLESKDIIYDYIMRMVKMITNFARTGYEISL